VPVFYNGSVNDPGIAASVVAQTDCDGVMIGRAGFGNPWIYGRVDTKLRHGTDDHSAPTLAEVRDTMLWHFDALCELFGDYLACRLMRRYGCWYIHGVHGGGAFRYRMSRIDAPERFHELAAEIFDAYPADTPAPLADWYDARPLTNDPDALTRRPIVEE
jgi:tRNA-dihydrouridine synthase B